MTRLWISFGSVVAAALVCGYLYGRYPDRVPPLDKIRARLLREEGIAPKTTAAVAEG